MSEDIPEAIRGLYVCSDGLPIHVPPGRYFHITDAELKDYRSSHARPRREWLGSRSTEDYWNRMILTRPKAFAG
jgi:hypothetical protein